MPIYEYTCATCGHDMEALQKMSAPPLEDCPECGKPELKKQISAAAFHLKGSGWYETDFKHSGKKKEDKAKSADADSGKETKPASSKGQTSDTKTSQSTSTEK